MLLFTLKTYIPYATTSTLHQSHLLETPEIYKRHHKAHRATFGVLANAMDICLQLNGWWLGPVEATCPDGCRRILHIRPRLQGTANTCLQGQESILDSTRYVQ